MKKIIHSNSKPKYFTDVRDSRGQPRCQIHHWPCVSVMFVFITVCYWLTFRFFDFYRESACCRRDIDITPPSVCPSNSGFETKLLHIVWNFYANRRGESRRREAYFYGVKHFSISKRQGLSFFIILAVDHLPTTIQFDSERPNSPYSNQRGGTCVFYGQICPCNSRGEAPAPSKKREPEHVNTVCCNATKLFRWSNYVRWLFYGVQHAPPTIGSAGPQ